MVNTQINPWKLTMSTIQPFQPVYNSQALQAAPEELRIGSGQNEKSEKTVRFTVRSKDDYEKAINLFYELAKEKDVQIRNQSTNAETSDYGGGKGAYYTVTFEYRPNLPHINESKEEWNKRTDLNPEFQQKLREANIRNYAPEE